MLVVMLLIALGLVVAMALAWLAQRSTSNVGWVDVVWSVAAGLAGAVAALLPPGADGVPTGRQLIVAALVILWSAGLALHLALRVGGGGDEDPRYRMLREEWAGRFQSRLFWFLEAQAVVTALLVLSIALAAHNPSPHWRLVDGLGAVLLIVALVGERVADRQLIAFRRLPASCGKVCDRGLWAWSRHPNYFFEWLAWLAYPLFAVEVDGSYPWGWLAIVGPILMYLLLVHASGIPPLEKHMLRSRGVAYEAYRRRTSAFFPRPPRAIDAGDAPAGAGE